MKKKWDSNYTAQVLKERRMGLSIGDYPIIYKFGDSVHDKLISKFRVNDADLLSDGELIPISYSQLKEFGYMLSWKKPEERFRRYMRKQYHICKQTENKPEMAELPRFHYIKYNPVTSVVILYGPNAGPTHVGDAVRVGKKKQKNPYDRTNYKNPDLYGDSYEDSVISSLPFKLKHKDEFIEIQELVIGYSEDGKVVCVDNKIKDPPILANVGDKGTGKTLNVHRFMDQLYHKTNMMVVSMNDVNAERGSWGQPWGKYDTFFETELKKLNEPTIPLPMVNLHINTKALKNNEMIQHNGFKITLPFREVMIRSNEYFSARKELKIGKSLAWFRRIMNNKDFFKNQTLPDLLAFIDAELPDNKDAGIRDKIKVVVTDIWNSNILDVSTSIPSKWVLRFPDGSKKKYYSWEACMRAGVIPNIVTRNLQNKFFYQGVILFIYEKIYKMQSEPDMKSNYVFIENDEMDYLMEDKTLQKLMNKVVLEGRMNRVGLIYTTQYYGKITEKIRTNTTHLFAFSQGSDKQAKEIIKDRADLEKNVHLKLLKQLKPFECLAFPNFFIPWLKSLPPNSVI